MVAATSTSLPCAWSCASATAPKPDAKRPNTITKFPGPQPSSGRSANPSIPASQAASRLCTLGLCRCTLPAYATAPRADHRSGDRGISTVAPRSGSTNRAPSPATPTASTASTTNAADRRRPLANHANPSAAPARNIVAPGAAPCIHPRTAKPAASPALTSMYAPR